MKDRELLDDEVAEVGSANGRPGCEIDYEGVEKGDDKGCGFVVCDMEKGRAVAHAGSPDGRGDKGSLISGSRRFPYGNSPLGREMIAPLWPSPLAGMREAITVLWLVEVVISLNATSHPCIG